MGSGINVKWCCNYTTGLTEPPCIFYNQFLKFVILTYTIVCVIKISETTLCIEKLLFRYCRINYIREDTVSWVCNLKQMWKFCGILFSACLVFFITKWYLEGRLRGILFLAWFNVFSTKKVNISLAFNFVVFIICSHSWLISTVYFGWFLHLLLFVGIWQITR